MKDNEDPLGNDNSSQNDQPDPGRRKFIKNSGVATAAFVLVDIMGTSGSAEAAVCNSGSPDSTSSTSYNDENFGNEWASGKYDFDNSCNHCGNDDSCAKQLTPATTTWINPAPQSSTAATRIAATSRGSSGHDPDNNCAIHLGAGVYDMDEGCKQFTDTDDTCHYAYAPLPTYDKDESRGWLAGAVPAGWGCCGRPPAASSKLDLPRKRWQATAVR